MPSSFSFDFNELIEWLWRRGELNRRALREFAAGLKVPGDYRRRHSDPRNHRWKPLSQSQVQALKDLQEKDRLLAKPYLSFRDPRFPSKLERLADPPCGFYFRGQLQALAHSGPWIGVVGTRRASTEALRFCESLIEGLKAASPLIVSGLAEGIDGSAHRAALRAGLKTVGVLGSGLDRIYPTHHRPLAREMIAEGLLLSELAPGTRTQSWHFPQRNRLIAALSDILVVVEAPEKSGALITADFALDLGMEIYVVPGRAASPQNRGGHRLIQQGARLLMEPEDILLDLGWKPPRVRTSAAEKDIPERPPSGLDPAFLSDQERKLLKVMGFQPVHVDKIIDMSHLPPARVLSRLQYLVLSGWLEEWPGKCFGLHPVARELLSNLSGYI